MNLQLKPCNQIDPLLKLLILKLDAQMPFPWKKSEWEHLPDRFFVCWLTSADSDKELKAFSLWEHLVWEDYAHLHKIVVDERYRKTGIGGAVHDFAINVLTQQYACTRLGLEVSTKNQAARSFYESHGWQLLNTIRSYYSNGDDAVRYQRLL